MDSNTTSSRKSSPSSVSPAWALLQSGCEFLWGAGDSVPEAQHSRLDFQGTDMEVAVLGHFQGATSGLCGRRGMGCDCLPLPFWEKTQGQGSYSLPDDSAQSLRGALLLHAPAWCELIYFIFQTYRFYLLTHSFLALPCGGLWDRSSLTWDRTWAAAVKAPGPNHWTTRELPGLILINSSTTQKQTTNL